MNSSHLWIVFIMSNYRDCKNLKRYESSNLSFFTWFLKSSKIILWLGLNYDKTSKFILYIYILLYYYTNIISNIACNSLILY